MSGLLVSFFSPKDPFSGTSSVPAVPIHPSRHPRSTHTRLTIAMDGGNAPNAKSRREKNRDSAATSRENKRERMGDDKYLQEKREAGVEYRKRKKLEREAASAATAAAAAVTAQPVAQPAPQTANDAAAQLAALAGLKVAGILDDATFEAAAAREIGRAHV